jgi:hypothetical protein
VSVPLLPNMSIPIVGDRGCIVEVIVHTFNRGTHSIRRVHPPTSSRPRTCILLNILHDFLGCIFPLCLILQCLVYIRSVRFIACADIDRFPQRLAVSWFDASTVHHDRWAIVPSKCHDDTRHILVAARNRDAGVVMLGARYGFDAVSDDFARLKGETHALNCKHNFLGP